MVALVTGASRGIGKELVLRLAKKGYDVIITYNTNKEKANDLKDKIEQEYNVKALSIKCDISNEEEIKELKENVINEFGNIDILINNAALAMDNYIDDKTKEEFMKVLEVNVVGTFLVTKYLYKNVTDTIVNISSTDAEDTYNDISIDYAVSKAGINMLTKVFSYSFKDVRVLGVMPNWTNTESIKEMNPDFLEKELKRIGQEKLEEPNEVATNIIDLIFDKNVKTGEIRRV